MNQKRILFTIHNGQILGGQKICMGCINIAKDMNLTPVLLSQTKGRFTEEIIRQGIRVYIKPMRRIFYIHVLPYILNILRREKVDIIHTHNTVATNNIMRIAAKISNIPLISHMHVENHFNKLWFRSRIIKLIDNATSKTCFRIISVSNYTKEELIGQGYDKDMITPIHNYIDLDKTDQNNNKKDYNYEFQIPYGGTVLIHIGRLCESKGQKDLIKSMKSLVEKDKGLYCLLVGEENEGTAGRFKEQLLRMIRRHGLDKHIRLLGYRDDIDALLEYSDILILPSYKEGLPIVILEAMEHKKPVIAYQASGVQEQIENNVNGYLIDKGDIETLRIKIMELAKNKKLRECMGNAGYKILKEKFNYRKFRDGIENVYKEVLLNIEK